MAAVWTEIVLATVLLGIPFGMGRLLTGGKSLRLTMLGGLFASFCVFEALAMVFHVTQGSLRVMTALWCAVCGGLAVWGWLRARRTGWPQPEGPALRWDRVEKLLLAAAVALIALQTLNTVLNTFYGNWDDETYCGTAVTSWYTDTVNRYAPSTGAWQPPFYNQKYVIASWPVYSSMLAVLTGVHPAILFRTVLPLFEMPLAYWVAYRLLRCFFAQSRKKALLGLLYFQVFVWMAAESMGEHSGEWWMLVNCWTGKSVGGGVIVPLILWLMVVLPDADAPARGGCWKILFLTCCAGCFVSASMFFLIPVQVALWGGVYVLHSRDAKALLRLGACAVPAAVCILAALL